MVHSCQCNWCSTRCISTGSTTHTHTDYILGPKNVNHGRCATARNDAVRRSAPKIVPIIRASLWPSFFFVGRFDVVVVCDESLLTRKWPAVEIVYLIEILFVLTQRQLVSLTLVTAEIRLYSVPATGWIYAPSAARSLWIAFCILGVLAGTPFAATHTNSLIWLLTISDSTVRYGRYCVQEEVANSSLQ